MSRVHHERIVCGGMLVEALRQQDPRAEVGFATPELGQQLALDPDVLQIFRLLRVRKRRDLLLERDRDRAAGRRIDSNPARLAEQVPRFGAPDLAFPVIRRQLHDVAVFAVVGLVDVQHRLDRVIARRHLREAFDGKADGRVVDDGRRVRCEPVDVDAKELERLFRVLVRADLLPRLAHVETRLAFRIGREQQQDPTVDRRPAARFRDDDVERERRLTLACRHHGAQNQGDREP